MIKNLSMEKVKFLNLFIWLLPFSIILGNLFINLNSLLIILLGFYTYKNNLFKFIKKYIYYVILFLTFIFINMFISVDFTLSLKGITGLIKNILLSLILYFWLKNEDTNLKNILLSIFFAQIILMISLYINLGYLHFFNSNIDTGMRLSGLFIDEYVAGSYIIKLLIPSIFLFVLFFKNNIYLIFFVLLSLVSILITGDRAPAFLFFLAFLFFIIFNKNLKFKDNLKIIFSFSLIILIFFFSSSNFRTKVVYTSGQLGLNYIEKKIYNIQKNFFNERVDSYSEWIKTENRDNNYNFTDTQWFEHYSKAFEIGKQNILFGSGIKTFREACKIPIYNKKFEDNHNSNYGCATHPHNIYIEIFSEAGLFGIFIFISLILKLILKTKVNKNNMIKTFIYCSVIILFFPVQTTGSFFSTFNGIFYFIITSINFYIIEFYKSSK